MLAISWFRRSWDGPGNRVDGFRRICDDALLRPARDSSCKSEDAMMVVCNIVRLPLEGRRSADLRR